MHFSCSGNITKWTFVARSRTGEDHNQYPLFQLWRPSGRYERVYGSSSDSGVFVTEVLVPELTIGKYLPHDPVPFHNGDVLGVYQPGSSANSRLSLIHVSVPTGVGHDNFVWIPDIPLRIFVGNDHPLIAVNTSEN